MKRLEIMLVCAGGMSSGFVAQAMRRAAKKENIDANIFARGESEIAQYINKIDVLLISPHFTALLSNPDILKMVEENNVFMTKIDSEAYGYMDGESVMRDLMQKLKEKGDLI